VGGAEGGAGGRDLNGFDVFQRRPTDLVEVCLLVVWWGCDAVMGGREEWGRVRGGVRRVVDHEVTLEEGKHLARLLARWDY
jgi:hypothetical protein